MAKGGITASGADTSALAYFGDVYETTYSRMRLAYGKPMGGRRSGRVDTQCKWALEFERDGRKIVFTAYDWKDSRVFTGNDVVRFRVGAASAEDSAEALAALKKQTTRRANRARENGDDTDFNPTQEEYLEYCRGYNS